MLHSFVNKFMKEEDGQDLVEYSLLLSFIALGTVAAVTAVQGEIKTLWGTINTQLGSANAKAAAGS